MRGRHEALALLGARPSSAGLRARLAALPPVQLRPSSHRLVALSTMRSWVAVMTPTRTNHGAQIPDDAPACNAPLLEKSMSSDPVPSVKPIEEGEIPAMVKFLNDEAFAAGVVADKYPSIPELSHAVRMFRRLAELLPGLPEAMKDAGRFRALVASGYEVRPGTEGNVRVVSIATNRPPVFMRWVGRDLRDATDLMVANPAEGGSHA